MGFPTPFLKLKPKLQLEPPIGGYSQPRPISTAAAKRSLMRLRLRCALDSDNVPPMTVSITGATGFIGRRLVQKLLSVSTYPGVTIAEQGDWEACVRGSSSVVNLAGMPISTRWSPEIKQEIKQSRVSVTSKVVKYINHAGNADAKPSVFVSATAIGYYGTYFMNWPRDIADELASIGTSEIHSFDESSPSGNDYLAEVLEGQKVLPVKANDLGFSYRYPYVEDALKAIARDL
ncbi:Epimerase family protein SDR39U1-like protein, chloroplastic [Dichanthelium oligosanthes]|uniref:Epimerase family protein SDR39U1-like protein, chloroplastic n=1 Tax=Dichanthelium oligosanthes TaxID=888268 RepID=A0A1E5VB05_9POAL|nr:Epimerase family protein SDR39U1-like protein, chloroplastic [Dichanthelium oligosanthes]